MATTSEDLKRQIPMRDVVEKYGLKIGRNKMCSCPFHGKDKHPSMRIYDDSFYCFTCSATGDIFAFTQKMERCDFKTAFLMLGGEYEQHDNSQPQKRDISALRRRRRLLEQQQTIVDQKRERKRVLAEFDELLRLQAVNKAEMQAYYELANEEIPFSDEWCEYELERFQRQIKGEELEKKLDGMEVKMCNLKN